MNIAKIMRESGYVYLSEVPLTKPLNEIKKGIRVVMIDPFTKKHYGMTKFIVGTIDGAKSYIADIEYELCTIKWDNGITSDYSINPLNKYAVCYNEYIFKLAEQ